MENTKNPILSELPPENELVTISLEPTTEQIVRLCTLMQKGCYLKIECGKSMRDVLCRQCGISPEYVRVDIKVMFLESSPVDNIDEAIIKDGATIALSAAMPGLVGAAMRKDGLTWMRTSITYHEGEAEHNESLGLIQMKLFNQVMADLGESFLKRGVYIKAGFLYESLKRFAPDFWLDFIKIAKNDEATTGQDLLEYLKERNEWVKLLIH
ncbi:MAG: hypothetical protein PHO83_06625 [Geobacteraceae bacterium]|nr:hypothetical protein [Geobacteraceae bacterium]